MSTESQTSRPPAGSSVMPKSAALIIHGMHEWERIAEGLNPCATVRGGVKDRTSARLW